jgi:hypothetical protein
VTLVSESVQLNVRVDQSKIMKIKRVSIDTLSEASWVDFLFINIFNRRAERSLARPQILKESQI